MFERGIPQGDITSLGSQPTGITTGPDGNIWFTELGDLANHVPAAIGRITINALASITTQHARVSSSGSATVRLVCGRGVVWRCVGSLTLFHRTVEHEAGCNACVRVKITSLSHPQRFSIKPGASASVKISLTGTGRRLLGVAKRHQLSAVAQASILPSNTQAPLQLTA
ncbi:MAG: hypothetical protein M3065_16085 [Actinomycetota bacterium]|nr:hypothetical protein [Actinomycetota bacterium]